MATAILLSLACAARQPAAVSAAGEQVATEKSGAIEATAAVRIHVINLTGMPVGFAFRLNAVQLIDTVANAGTLNVPVLSKLLQLTPSEHRIQLLDKRTMQMREALLKTSPAEGQNHATIELVFESNGSRITTCHCVRVYGGGG